MGAWLADWGLDSVMLSRIQFAANISFHILFPKITIALAWILLFFKLAYERTKNLAWMDSYHFWVKVFALSFALGVVSGIVMSFQFGTNWPGFMLSMGNVAGPLLAYEVISAFFLEATFIGIMLFGFHRVKNWIHTLATFLVAVGTTLSAFWILALNSWMQTPQGHVLRDGVVHAESWWEILWTPSMPYRFSHVLLASTLTATFLVAGLSAYRWLKGDRGVANMHALRLGVYVAAAAIPVQILVGDLHGLNTLEHQPQKVAAMEAHWESRANAPFILFAWPDEETRENFYEVAIPGASSLILGHSLDAVVPGLNDYVGNHPPVAPVFFAFRLMLLVGFLMLVVSWWSAWQLRRRGTIKNGTARLLVFMTFSGWVASLAGWYVTEIGRQPWLVWGLLPTADAAGPVAATTVLGSVLVYILIYLSLLGTFIGVLFYLARRAIELTEQEEPPPTPMALPGRVKPAE